jgi:hypothetical protein
MSKFVLEINTDGAAFDEEAGGDLLSEIQRALGEVSARLGKYDGLVEVTGKVRDINGNNVGEWRYEA